MAKTKPGKKDLDSYSIKGTNKIVRPGDCVLMRPSDSDKPPYVARVEKIEADHRNNVKVRVRWYYRPEESLGGRRQFHGAKELFLSDHYDVQSAHTIEGKCIVHTFKNYTKLENVGAEDYFCRFEYKAATGGFTPDRVAVYCKCEMPYNPDDLMVQCEGCKDWFHPSCMGMTIEEAKKLEHFMCAECSSDDDAKRSLNSFPVSPSVQTKDLSSKGIFGKGYERDGLHYFGDPPDEPSSSSLASFQASILSAFMSCVFNIQTLELWHARMGHVNFQYLCQLFPSFNKACKDSKFHYMVCELSKHTRTSYIPYVTRAPSAFDLIHSDVWGPSPVIVFSSHRYYVTFIDDHTRCTWVYLIHRKSDVFPIFVQFLQIVKTQFHAAVKTICSDNSEKYISNAFHSHLNQISILQQLVVGPLNKMVLLNAKIVILCLLSGVSFEVWVFPSLIGI
ncbi:uncharacterized protein LOC114275392 isoform X1 [Camellia sinensis]|uniref:uncharacterized protein LOC114275392 isoform X1 n=1 Tax=Camellia sinensis TaxID=4442 RepID=UPI0010359B01|nr:uncharacterized protein LOC114275392 isoform X1 [Camellia sinensis]